MGQHSHSSRGHCRRSRDHSRSHSQPSKKSSEKSEDNQKGHDDLEIPHFNTFEMDMEPAGRPTGTRRQRLTKEKDRLEKQAAQNIRRSRSESDCRDVDVWQQPRPVRGERYGLNETFLNRYVELPASWKVLLSRPSVYDDPRKPRFSPPDRTFAGAPTSLFDAHPRGLRICKHAAKAENLAETLFPPTRLDQATGPSHQGTRKILDPASIHGAAGQVPEHLRGQGPYTKHCTIESRGVVPTFTSPDRFSKRIDSWGDRRGVTDPITHTYEVKTRWPGVVSYSKWTHP